MSSCSSEVPIFFQVNGMCTGHGVCVNSTIIPNLMLCKCDSYHNGGSDYFDSRVELLPNGEYLSLACNNSMIGVYIVWSIWILVGIIRCSITFPIWLDFCRKHFSDSVLRSKGIFDTPFRIITMDLFAINSLLFIAGFAKMYGLTIGTHILPTVCYNTAVLLYQVSSFDLSKMEFDIFVQCSSNTEQATKAKNIRLTLKLIGLILTICLVYIPGTISLALDKTQGPLLYDGNGQEIIIYLRNIDVIIYIPLEILSTWMILRRIKMVFVFNGASDESAVKHIVKKMEDTMKFYTRSIGFLMLVYVCFSVPYLLPYQTYCLSLVIGIGIATPNSKAFATEQEKEKIKTLSIASKTSQSSKETKSKPDRAVNSYTDSSHDRVISLDSNCPRDSVKFKNDSGLGLDDKTVEMLSKDNNDNKDNRDEIERVNSERILQIIEHIPDEPVILT